MTGRWRYHLALGRFAYDNRLDGAAGDHKEHSNLYDQFFERGDGLFHVNSLLCWPVLGHSGRVCELT